MKSVQRFLRSVVDEVHDAFAQSGTPSVEALFRPEEHDLV